MHIGPFTGDGSEAADFLADIRDTIDDLLDLAYTCIPGGHEVGQADLALRTALHWLIDAAAEHGIIPDSYYDWADK